jgi:prepilin-type processing-associated H-X9-DG protein
MFLTGPQDNAQPNPGLFIAPTTHFRHAGKTAIVSFLDGHVEAWTTMPNVPVPAHWPQNARDLKEKLAIDYLSDKSVELYRPW